MLKMETVIKLARTKSRLQKVRKKSHLTHLDSFGRAFGVIYNNDIDTVSIPRNLLKRQKIAIERSGTKSRSIKDGPCTSSCPKSLDKKVAVTTAPILNTIGIVI